MIIKRNNIREIAYNSENIEKYKSSDNLLRHARYIPGRTQGIMLVDNRNNLVGYIAWEKDYIIALEVTEKYRHQGIATSLLKSCPAKPLTVAKDNIPAINLYKSLGWKKSRNLGRMIKMIKR